MEPASREVAHARARVMDWFVSTAPLVEWSDMESPLGLLYLARSEVGLCRLMFGVEEDEFRAGLPERSHTLRNPDALKSARDEMTAYFAKRLDTFTIPVDLGDMTAFQQRVLRLACAIPAGHTRSYGQLAREVGSPRAGRAVGQALGRNPVPIVVPCHRVLGSQGQLGGYSGGNGVASKRWLLHLEGALQAEAAHD